MTNISKRRRKRAKSQKDELPTERTRRLGLMDLPLEIRHMIYNYLWHPHQPIRLWRTSDNKGRVTFAKQLYFNASWFRVCKEFQSAGEAIIYRRGNWVLDSTGGYNVLWAAWRFGGDKAKGLDYNSGSDGLIALQMESLPRSMPKLHRLERVELCMGEVLNMDPFAHAKMVDFAKSLPRLRLLVVSLPSSSYGLVHGVGKLVQNIVNLYPDSAGHRPAVFADVTIGTSSDHLGLHTGRLLRWEEGRPLFAPGFREAAPLLESVSVKGHACLQECREIDKYRFRGWGLHKRVVFQAPGDIRWGSKYMYELFNYGLTS